MKVTGRPLYHGQDTRTGAIRALRLLGEDLVLWRSGGGAMAWLDLCIHRGSRFSMGRVHGGGMVRLYHGWRYDREAATCRPRRTWVDRPASPIPPATLR